MSTMAEHSCENCKLRARYDQNPRSLLGRVWRWHANFCPGLRGYLRLLPEDKRAEFIERYRLEPRAEHRV